MALQRNLPETDNQTLAKDGPLVGVTASARHRLNYTGLAYWRVIRIVPSVLVQRESLFLIEIDSIGLSLSVFLSFLGVAVLRRRKAIASTFATRGVVLCVHLETQSFSLDSLSLLRSIPYTLLQMTFSSSFPSDRQRARKQTDSEWRHRTK